METGRSDGSPELLKNMAKVFGISMDELVSTDYQNTNSRQELNQNSNSIGNSILEPREFLEFLKEENKRLWGIIAKLTNDPSFCVGNNQHALQECKVIALPDTDLKSVA